MGKTELIALRTAHINAEAARVKINEDYAKRLEEIRKKNDEEIAALIKETSDANTLAYEAKVAYEQGVIDLAGEIEIIISDPIVAERLK